MNKWMIWGVLTPIFGSTPIYLEPRGRVSLPDILPRSQRFHIDRELEDQGVVFFQNPSQFLPMCATFAPFGRKKTSERMTFQSIGSERVSDAWMSRREENLNFMTTKA